ncbi:hypothetical protein IH601_09035, partial [Candidatus Bipolaricaulota bacterium]|nr:hypothetical protein [Candidatus Bipolaricaulota bacterium]
MSKLGIVCVVGMLLAVGSIGGGAQEDFSLSAEFGVRAIAELAETQLRGLIDAMHVMTATANLRTGDWD